MPLVRDMAARLGTVNNVTIATTSTAVASTAFGAQTYQIRVAAPAACFALVVTPLTASTTDATAATTSALIPANSPEYFKVSPGQKLSVFSATTQVISCVEVTG